MSARCSSRAAFVRTCSIDRAAGQGAGDELGDRARHVEIGQGELLRLRPAEAHRAVHRALGQLREGEGEDALQACGPKGAGGSA